jgi:hypothetical protein
MATKKATPETVKADDKAPAKTEPESIQKDIIVQSTVITPELIDIKSDHSFSLDDGHYVVEINITPQSVGYRTRIIDITNANDPRAIEYSTSSKLIGEIYATEDRRYLAQYQRNRQWAPIQTLPREQYNITLTRQ